jgi:hypothetical protein
MARISRWDEYVTCNRSVPFTKDGECDGRVRVHGYAWPADREGPSGGVAEVDACDKCGFADWSPEEIAEMSREARNDA